MGQAKERKHPDGSYRMLKGPGYKAMQEHFQKRVLKWAKFFKEQEETHGKKKT